MLCLVFATASGVLGQRLRPQTTSPVITFQGSQGGLVPATSVVPPTVGNFGTVTLQQPTFDPYATAPNAASIPPALPGAPNLPGNAGAATPYWQSPPATTPGFGGAQGYPPSGGLPPTAYPQQPPVLFPGGMDMPYSGWPQAQPGPYLRLFQDLRFRYTWLAGESGPNKLEINEIDLATTVNFPNFMYSGLPLQVSPGFIFDFWSGPSLPPPNALPSRAYSAFVDFGWQPVLTPVIGADLTMGVGVFSDFKKVRSEAVRIYGTGLLVLNLTPTVTLKAGVNYLDRVDIKLLPAGGILWTPNSQTRFDIYFPRPKLAQYLTTIGNTDIWWYLNGEYGGGSWLLGSTLPGADGMIGTMDDVSAQINTDINDIRAGGGIEWNGHHGVRGFVEVAYVFERDVIYNSPVVANLSLDETIMMRGGLVY
jgi:hypothetical protein